MTAYPNCKVGDVRQVTMDSGEAGVGYRRTRSPAGLAWRARRCGRL